MTAGIVLRASPSGCIPPCLPSPAERMPSGPGWVHKIKHGGFRIIARKHYGRVRLYNRPGNDLTNWFPLTRRGAGACIA
jgi:bifunctional non-homologous end joining protein LigD